VSGCDTGTPPYWGIDPVRVDVGEMVFDVRQKGAWRSHAPLENV